MAESTSSRRHDDLSFSHHVESSLRNEQLDFNHHKAVAPLEPEQQEYFLSKASEEKLSVRELREEVKKIHESNREGVNKNF